MLSSREYKAINKMLMTWGMLSRLELGESIGSSSNNALNNISKLGTKISSSNYGVQWSTEAARNEGAEVVLISGPTALSTLPDIKRINVVTAQQMLAAVMDHVEHCDIFICAAAVSDYRSANVSLQKMKKDQRFPLS